MSIGVAMNTETNCSALSPLSFFKCMSEDTRLKTLLLLSEHTSLCVCDLTTALDISQPKISRHLADLRKCGLVLDERKGKWVYYRLHPGLPGWASDVIHNTAKHNVDFVAQARANLKTGNC